MRLVNTNCWGCKYNRYDGVCGKAGDCMGVEKYSNYATTNGTSLIGVNNEAKQILPDEIEINGSKYRRVEK